MGISWFYLCQIISIYVKLYQIESISKMSMIFATFVMEFNMTWRKTHLT